MTIKRLIGSAPSQVSRNRDLGNLAFQNKEAPRFDTLTIDGNLGVGTIPTRLVEFSKSSDSSSSLNYPTLRIVNTLTTAGDGVTTYNAAMIDIAAGNGAVRTVVTSDLDSVFSGGRVGTLTNHSLKLVTNSIERLRIDASGDVTLSGGTANGVLYLNGSKAVTSGSALTFDGIRLSIDGSASSVSYKIKYNGTEVGFLQNYQNTELNFGTAVNAPILFYINNAEQMRLTSTGLGIGTSSPASKLDVVGSASVGIRYKSSGNYGAVVADNSSTTGGGLFVAQQNGTQYAIFGVAGAIQGNTSTDTGIFADGTGSSIKLYTNGFPTPKATLDASGNLGIGVSPTPVTNYKMLEINGTGGGYIRQYVDGSLAGYWYVGTGESGIGTVTSIPLLFFTNGAKRMHLDSSGNLGLGVTPSAWRAEERAAQIGAVTAVTDISNYSVFRNNHYVNSSNQEVRMIDGPATAFVMTPTGEHRFLKASSGTAGDPISFTQAMTLDASGRLGIGRTNPSYPLHIQGSDSTGYSATSAPPTATTIMVQNASSADGSQATISLVCQNAATNSQTWNITNASTPGGTYAGNLVFQQRTGYTTYAERLRIDSSGNLGLGVTPSAWSNSTAIVVGTQSALSNNVNLGSSEIINNAYQSAASTYTYRYSGAASLQRQVNGQHQWFTAPSGTAGNPISFTQAMTLTSGALLQVAYPGNTSYYAQLDASDGNGHVRAPTSGMALVFDVSGSERARIDSSGNFYTGADNTQTLGSASKRWSVVYAGTGTINTSDAREKTAVRPLTDAEIAAAKQLSKEIGAYRWLSAVEQKGDATREHIGMTVQRAIEIMEANDLNPFHYGFICYDQWDEVTVEHPAMTAIEAKDAVLDEEGNIIEPAVEAVEAKAAWTEVTQEAGDRYSFRMDELNLFLARGFDARLAALEAK